MKRFCKNCRMMFEITAGEQHFYSLKGWPNPKNCPVCRKLRKDPYWGWESTFGACGSRKTRHHRVAYPVHTVGGFR